MGASRRSPARAGEARSSFAAGGGDAPVGLGLEGWEGLDRDEPPQGWQSNARETLARACTARPSCRSAQTPTVGRADGWTSVAMPRVAAAAVVGCHRRRRRRRRRCRSRRGRRRRRRRAGCANAARGRELFGGGRRGSLRTSTLLITGRTDGRMTKPSHVCDEAGLFLKTFIFQEEWRTS